MLLVRQEVQQKARAPEEIIKAASEVMKAEAGVVQAVATCRVTAVKLISITGF